MTKRLPGSVSSLVSLQQWGEESSNLWAVYHSVRDDFSSDSLVTENRSADGGELRALMDTWRSCDFTMTPLTVFLHKQPSHCRPRSTKPPSGLNPMLDALRKNSTVVYFGNAGSWDTFGHIIAHLMVPWGCSLVCLALKREQTRRYILGISQVFWMVARVF